MLLFSLLNVKWNTFLAFGVLVGQNKQFDFGSSDEHFHTFLSNEPASLLLVTRADRQVDERLFIRAVCLVLSLSNPFLFGKIILNAAERLENEYRFKKEIKNVFKGTSCPQFLFCFQPKAVTFSSIIYVVNTNSASLSNMHQTVHHQICR